MIYTIKEIQLECPHCKGIDFQKGQAQMNSAMMTFLGLDWLDQSANIFSCTNCGKIQWFAHRQSEQIDDLSDDTECLACGGKIFKGQSSCQKCGWSYK